MGGAGGHEQCVLHSAFFLFLAGQRDFSPRFAGDAEGEAGGILAGCEVGGGGVRGGGGDEGGVG